MSRSSHNSGLVLENEFLRVEIDESRPTRLASMLDKRSGNAFAPIRYNWSEVAHFSHQAGEDVCWIGFANADTFVHLGWTLLPGRAALDVDLRVYNRGLKPAALELCVYLPAGVLHAPDPACPMPAGKPTIRWIAPHRMMAWRETVAPANLQGDVFASRSGALGIVGTELHIAVWEPFERAKLVVTPKGAAPQTMVTNLTPDRILATRITCLPYDDFEVRLEDFEGNVIVDSQEPFLAPRFQPTLTGTIPGSLPELFELAHDPAWSNVSNYLIGLHEARAKRLANALTYFEEALHYNSADLLAWMMRAACLRRLGRDEESADELVGVHKMAPLEPLLRAEAFLNTPLGTDSEASSLLQPFSGDDCTLLRISEFYIAAGFLDDAVRWLKEAERFMGPNPTYHYLLGYCYHLHGAMAVSAAEEFAKARRLGESIEYESEFVSTAVSVAGQLLGCGNA